MNPKTLKEAIRIMRKQNELIGSLTIENNFLKDSEYRRNEWLSEAKQQAGFKDSVSFDVVWEKLLKSYKVTNT